PSACGSALGMLRVCKEVATSAKVLLTGDGGDDLFLGYHRHRHRWLAQVLARLTPHVASGRWRSARRGFAPGPFRRAVYGLHPSARHPPAPRRPQGCPPGTRPPEDRRPNRTGPQAGLLDSSRAVARRTLAPPHGSHVALLAAGWRRVDPIGGPPRGDHGLSP